MRVWASMVLGAGLLAAEQPKVDTWDQMNRREIFVRSSETIGWDLKALATAPFDYPKETGWFLGGSLVLVTVDRPLTEAWQRQVEPNVNYNMGGLWRSRSGGLAGSDTWLVATLPVWYFSSLAADSGKGQAAVLLGTKAVLYSYLVSHVVLKTAFARERPNPALGLNPPESPKTYCPWVWGNYHRPYFDSRPDGTGFPSFHATLYASVATVFAEVYNTPWAPSGLALLLFGADLKGHQHWVSDMASGTALGIGLGKVVVRQIRTSPKAPRADWPGLCSRGATCRAEQALWSDLSGSLRLQRPCAFHHASSGHHRTLPTASFDRLNESDFRRSPCGLVPTPGKPAPTHSLGL